MDRSHKANFELNHLQVNIGRFTYQDTVTVTSKGLEMELASEDFDYLHHH
jgi:hypothetical protein